jgi:hypothetical protein
LIKACGQLRKHREDSIKACSIAAQEHAYLEVLADRETPKHCIFLRHVAETQTHAPVSRHVRQVAPANQNSPTGQPQLAHDRLHQGRFASTVASQNSYSATRIGGEGDIEQHLAATITRRHTANFEQRRVRHG